MSKLRLLDIGLASGLLAGLLTAILARVNMRLVALADSSVADDVETGFTGETAWVLFVVTLSAVKGGMLYVAIRRWLPKSIALSGLTFGLLLLLLPGLPMMLFEGDFSIGPAGLTLPLFGALFPCYGLAVAFLVRGLEAAWPSSRPLPAVAVSALVPLALLGLLSLLIIVPFSTH